MQKVVFIVDDDPSILRGVERLLKAHGFAPGLFNSAEDLEARASLHEAVCLVLATKLNSNEDWRAQPFPFPSFLPPARTAAPPARHRCKCVASCISPTPFPGDCCWMRTRRHRTRACIDRPWRVNQLSTFELRTQLSLR